MSHEDLLVFEELASVPPPKRVSPQHGAFQTLSLLDGTLDFSTPVSGNGTTARNSTRMDLLWLDSIPSALSAPILQPIPAAPSQSMVPILPPTVAATTTTKQESRRSTSPFDLDVLFRSLAPGNQSSPENRFSAFPSSASQTVAKNVAAPVPNAMSDKGSVSLALPLLPPMASTRTLLSTTPQTSTVRATSSPALPSLVPIRIKTSSGSPSMSATTVESSSPTSHSSADSSLSELPDEQEMTPRPYQIQMYEKAMKENIIAVMDTGTGKTLVAAMLIKEIIRREAEADRGPAEKKLCFFVVGNVPLVKQQADVIRKYCRTGVAELCGASKTKKLQESLWAEISESTFVVVLTAQILLDVLRHGFWHMQQINLLVFDECHHARKDHPFCLIMSELYHNKRLKVTDRPRIFGMTASPPPNFGSKTDQSFSELERTLDSRVVSVDREQVEEFVEKPIQIVTYYNPPPKYNPTRLTLRMRRICGMEPKLLQTLSDVSINLAQLGPWCVDQIWRLAVDNLTDSPRSTTIAREHLKSVKDIIESTTFPNPVCNDENLTPKIQKLIQILRVASNSLKDDFCGIIFVQRRDTAVALTVLLQELEELQDSLRVQVLAGHSEGNHALLNMSLKEQQIIINRFRDKQYNLLVSTSVAEEGLDIQPCNIVIRFDPVTTTTSYIQSRGRARQKNSRYIMMQETNNLKEEAVLDNVQYGEQTMRERCNNLARDRPNKDLGEEDDLIQDKSALELQYPVDSTQALLTLSSAIPLLIRYCAALPTNKYCAWKPEFDVVPSGSSFICDLTLPAAAPGRFFQSDRTSTMEMARKSAAYKACEALHKLGAIDDHLEPVIVQRVMDEDGNGGVEEQLANPTEPHVYPRNSPMFWSLEGPITMQGQPIRLYACTVSFDGSDLSPPQTQHTPASQYRKYRVMCILTKQPLPFSQHDLNVYIRGKKQKVVLRTSLVPLEFTDDQIELLRMFTLLLFKRMSKKNFDCERDRMPYYIGPLEEDSNNDDLRISWDDTVMGQTLQSTPLTPMMQSGQLARDDVLLDLVFMIGQDRSRDYFVQDIVQDLKVTDVMPVPRFQTELDAFRNANPDDHSFAIAVTFEAYFLWKYKHESPKDEIMVMAQRVKRMRNHLHSDAIESVHRDDVRPIIVPLSACSKCTVSASVLRMSQVIPSALFDLDSFLLVQEAHKRIGLTGVALDELQVAMTTSSANREYHYERLEFLGDAFLKFVSTIRLFIVNPSKGEGQLHHNRTLVISNSALLRHAVDLELYRYITSVPFHRKSWRPVRFVVEGIPWDSDANHMLSNKTMADVVEACLGTAFLSGGLEVAFHAAKALRIPFDGFEKWRDFERVYRISVAQREQQQRQLGLPTEDLLSSSTERTSLNQHSSLLHLDALSIPGPMFNVTEYRRQINTIQKLLGYTFRNPMLFLEAMTHPSSARRDSLTYERLEWLGDAVLDFQVVKWCYLKHDTAPPGAMTMLKGASVNNQVLGSISILWGLGEFLDHNSEPLAREIERAILDLQIKKEESPSSTLEGEYWVDIKMPKVLGDLVESTLGAVFVDSGFDFEVISDLFERLIRPFLDEHISLDHIVIHPTASLTEHVQDRGCTECKFEREDFDDSNVAGAVGMSKNSNILRRLGLGLRAGGAAQGKDTVATQVCRFIIHGQVIAHATGTHIEELRKEVALATLAKLQADPTLLAGLCTCSTRREGGHATMLDKYQGSSSRLR